MNALPRQLDEQQGDHAQPQESKLRISPRPLLNPPVSKRRGRGSLWPYRNHSCSASPVPFCPDQATFAPQGLRICQAASSLPSHSSGSKKVTAAQGLRIRAGCAASGPPEHEPGPSALSPGTCQDQGLVGSPAPPPGTPWQLSEPSHSCQPPSHPTESPAAAAAAAASVPASRSGRWP